MENGRQLWRNRKFLRLIQQEKIPPEVESNGGFIGQRKPSTAPRRVTFQDDHNEVVDGQRMMVRRNGRIYYRALAGMK